MIKGETKQINWGTAIFLISYQVILFLTLPFYFYYCTPHTGTLISAFVLLWLTGLSITAGYHRYFAHRSYKAHPIVEAILVFFGTMAVQASVIRWSFEHRLHHAFVDTDKDPYSIKKGFWYAHFFWMMEKLQPIDPKIVPDLLKNKLLAFQHRHYKLLMVATNALVFFVVGAAFQDYWGAFFIAVWLRIFFLQHFTWFINSLAHTWGSKHFSMEQSAVDNFIIAFLTFGEGYHNYHHTFANDYRNGIRWFHFDPTKWLIWTLSKIGLAHSLKRTDPLTIKKRIVIEHKEYLIETLSNYWKDKKHELEKQVHDLSERILASMSEFSQLKEAYQKSKSDVSKACSLEQIKADIRQLQKNLRDDWRAWKELSHNILHPAKG
ncbi:MAG: acyl-CoA desaturase [Parachlamydiaceae bacterium]